MENNMQNATPLLTIFDSFVRPFVRESQIRIPVPTNNDQVKKNKYIQTYKGL